MAKSQFREEIAQAITAEKVQAILDKCMDQESHVEAMCPRSCSKGYKFRAPSFDAKTALEAAKWAVEQGYGKVPNAKPVEEINFADRDPLTLPAEERGMLFEKVLAAMEGKASPPSSRGMPASS